MRLSGCQVNLEVYSMFYLDILYKSLNIYLFTFIVQVIIGCRTCYYWLEKVVTLRHDLDNDGRLINHAWNLNALPTVQNETPDTASTLFVY